MTRFKERLPSPRHAVIGAALQLGGGAIGVGATILTHPPMAMAPGAPVPIASLAQASRPWVGEPVVTVRGRVAEAYGSSFVIADASGRALVDIGRRDAGDAALAPSQLVTVQGRYDNGVLRARYLVGPDGRVAALGGGRGHRGDRHDRHGHRGFDRDDREAFTPDAPSGNAALPAPVPEV